MLPLALLLLGASPPDVCLVTLDGMGSAEGRELAERVVKRVLTDGKLAVQPSAAKCKEAGPCVTEAARALKARVAVALTVVTVDVRAFVDLEVHAVATGEPLGTATFVMTNGRESVSSELFALTDRIRDHVRKASAAAAPAKPLELTKPREGATPSEPAVAVAQAPDGTRSLAPRSVASWIATGAVGATAIGFTVAWLVSHERLQQVRQTLGQGSLYSVTRAEAERLVATTNLAFNGAWISALLTLVGVGLSTALSVIDLAGP